MQVQTPHAFAEHENASDTFPPFPPSLSLPTYRTQVVVSKALTLASIVVGLGPGVVLDVDDAARRISLDTLALSKLGYDCQVGACWCIGCRSGAAKRTVRSGGERAAARVLHVCR